ncbi:MAG: phosphoglycerate kinase [Gammaproteobacteria bacterium]
MRGVADIAWRGKIALLRADFNTPLAGGKITDDSRIRASLPTIQYILKNGGGVLCLSHLGRPQAGVFDSKLSLRPAAEKLSALLKTPAAFLPQFPGTKLAAGEIAMLENTRFNIGEKENAAELAARYAAQGDVFVMDAFAAAHRKECSVCALAAAAKTACAGMLFAAELEALRHVLRSPARPLLAIVGGGKVSTKLSALQRLLEICDYVIPGGGIANTFTAAAGGYTGASLTENKMLPQAAAMLKKYPGKIIMPLDFIAAEEINENAATRALSAEELPQLGAKGRILDIGEKTRANYAALIARAQTIIWNGPAGVFECAPFAGGTRALAEAVASSAAYSVAGGGDTLAAVAQFNAAAGISYLSTGGGAFLEYIGGGELPVLTALEAAG